MRVQKIEEWPQSTIAFKWAEGAKNLWGSAKQPGGNSYHVQPQEWETRDVN